MKWIPIFTLVCGVAIGSMGNIAHGNTDDCLISSKKSTITMYSKEGKLQERIVIRNNKITVYDGSGKTKNRGVVRNGQITMYSKEGAVAGRMVIEND
ncbi:MAG: hypothetical protein FJ266_10610 [Planctomycetes bacterium]|nr:hypothetical protein [Planctomycetota bacterium]